MVPFLSKMPKLLTMNIDKLESKVEYLFNSLGGTPSMLLDCPAFLSCNIENDIKPKVQLLRNMEKDPLYKGLGFLVKAKIKDFAVIQQNI